MQYLVEVLTSNFQGRPDAYAVQQGDGTYRPIRNPLSDEVINKHLQGLVTVGVYPVTVDGLCTFGVYDFDEIDNHVYQAIVWLRSYYLQMESRCPWNSPVTKVSTFGFSQKIIYPPRK